jgi:hypothetical protein
MDHLGRVNVDEMLSVDEELKAAKAAKAAIGALLTTTRKSEVLATLSKARRAAVLSLSSGGTLNEARGIRRPRDHQSRTPEAARGAVGGIEGLDPVFPICSTPPNAERDVPLP